MKLATYKLIISLASSASAVLLLAACSGGDVAPESSSSAKAAKPSPSTASEEVKGPVRAVRSTFTVDAKLRDPFFPGAKQTATSPAQGSPEVVTDVPTLLQAGFNGVVGAGEARIALINNVMLERGRTVTIPLGTGGQRREVTVRVREVHPNAVVLEIPGQHQPVTIRSKRL